MNVIPRCFHHSSEDKELQSNDSLLLNGATRGTSRACCIFRRHCARLAENKLVLRGVVACVRRAGDATADGIDSVGPSGVYGLPNNGHSLLPLLRAKRGFAAVGILYNHESPRRATKFLSQKIVRGCSRLRRTLEVRCARRSERNRGLGLRARLCRGHDRILSQPPLTNSLSQPGQPHTVEDFLRTRARVRA